MSVTVADNSQFVETEFEEFHVTKSTLYQNTSKLEVVVMNLNEVGKGGRIYQYQFAICDNQKLYLVVS